MKCLKCNHDSGEHDPEYDGECTYGAHGYTCSCKSFVPRAPAGVTDDTFRVHEGFSEPVVTIRTPFVPNRELIRESFARHPSLMPLLQVEGPMPLEMAGMSFGMGAACAFGLMGMAEAIRTMTHCSHWEIDHDLRDRCAKCGVPVDPKLYVIP